MLPKVLTLQNLSINPRQDITLDDETLPKVGTLHWLLSVFSLEGVIGPLFTSSDPEAYM